MMGHQVDRTVLVLTDREHDNICGENEECESDAHENEGLGASLSTPNLVNTDPNETDSDLLDTRQ